MVFQRAQPEEPGLPNPVSDIAGNDQVSNEKTGERVRSPFDPAPVMETSVIGTDLTILGEKITIISQNSLQIDGDVRGDVTGKHVTIGPEGSVTGTVSSEIVEVHGGIRGAIRALSVTLLPTAEVDGEIVHQKLAISEGAQFEGRVRRPKDPSELQPKLDASSYPGAPGSGDGNGATKTNVLANRPSTAT